LGVLEIRKVVLPELAERSRVVKEDVCICPLYNVLAKGVWVVVGSRRRLGV